MIKKIIVMVILIIIILFFITTRPKNITAFEEARLTFRFDDCYESQLEAYEILKQNNMTATFFCITDKIDNYDYMKLRQLIKIDKEGFEIGSHTKSHQNLLSTSKRELIEELAGSRRSLEKFNISVNALAYPYGIPTIFHPDLVKQNYACAGVYPLIIGGLNNVQTNRYGVKCRDIKNVEQFRKDLDNAVRKNAWLVACFHRIGDETGKYYTSKDEFIEIVNITKQYVDNKSIEIVSFSQGCTYLSEE